MPGVATASSAPQDEQLVKDDCAQRRRTAAMAASHEISRLVNGGCCYGELERTIVSLSVSCSASTLLRTLYLIKSAAKSLRFFKWIHKSRLLPHLPESYLTMLNILVRARNLDSARNFLFSIPKISCGTVPLCDRFFNCLIRGYGTSGLVNMAVGLFNIMNDMGVRPSVYTFNSLLSVLLSRGRTCMSKKLYQDMCDYPTVSPDVYTFNILIRGFCLNSMVEEGFRFFKEMRRLKCSADIITYNTLVDGLCRAGKVNIAHNLAKAMTNKDPHLNPNVVTYTTLIRGYCEKQMIADALLLFEEMISRDLKPTRITWNTLIQGLCEARELDKVKGILQDFKDFKPDTCTFNTLITAHCNAGNLKTALNMFERMSAMMIPQDGASYSILIRHLCQSGDFSKAEFLFDELVQKQIVLKNKGCTPLIAAFNPMFEFLCREGKTRKAESLFKQLMKRGVQDAVAFKTIIIGHCHEGTLQDGFNLLRLMIRREFVPDVDMYIHLINGFLRKQDSVSSYRTLKKMLKSGHVPRAKVFHAILRQLAKDGHAPEAAHLVKLTLGLEIRQDIILSTETVKVLLEKGLKDKALEIVAYVYDEGYSLKMDQVVTFLSRQKRYLEAQEFLLFTLSKNHEFDAGLCSQNIVDLCKTRSSQEAFSLFYELLERGHHLAISCLRDLKHSLELDQKFSEAAFVARQMHRRNQEHWT